MMNISPMVNSVKCTVFSRFVQFSHGLEGSTALYCGGDLVWSGSGAIYDLIGSG